MDKTAVVILHYKGEQDTRDCLASIIRDRKNDKNLKIILILSCGSDNFADEIKKKYPEVLVINYTENTGFAKGCNYGIKIAQDLDCKNIVLLNNDTLVTSDFPDKLVEFSSKTPRLGLVSPKIYFAKGFEYHKDKYESSERGKVIWYGGGSLDWSNIYASHWGVDEVDRGQYEKTKKTDFATGCCMLITKELIEKIGYFDEKYFLYFEDVDYSQRAQKAGFGVYYYPKIHIWHKNASSSDKPGSSIHIYYQTRNRLYFGLRYGSLRTKKSLIIQSLRMLFKNKVERKAVIDYYLGRMGKGAI